jgi:SAM-dependent methyltransferase
MVFDSKDALEINKARLDHLASLGIALDGKKVLEVGAGIGLLTSFFTQRSCEVTSTEARKELNKENLSRHPRRKGWVFQADLMQVASHDDLGAFDAVFCYGVLYHLPNPRMALMDLANVCETVFLLETMVWYEDDGKIHRTREPPSLDQSFYGHGCRPARDWVMEELRKHYEYVYITVTQPDHAQFPTSWPSKPGQDCRAVFVASRKEIVLKSLTQRLPRKQRRISFEG